MPRQARLDTVGLLQHVMSRGIEKRDIFLDDQDRKEFVRRLSELLVSTQTTCLAWSLMTNHFHLLLHPQMTKVSYLMRRLLTGYALTFNLRHKRSGHLFQNRYKSVVCQDESYLMRLIRYIHRNPVRAGVVPDIAALKTYPWSGHAVLLGETELRGQDTGGVLAMFGKKVNQARSQYCDFVADAEDEGHREEFCGGGLARSAALFGFDPTDEAYDDRVLGNGDFVIEVCGDDEQRIARSSVPLQKLFEEIAGRYGITLFQLCEPTKARRVAEARAVTCYLALRRLGYKGVDVANLLNISPSGVTVAARRGAMIAAADFQMESYLKAKPEVP